MKVYATKSFLRFKRKEALANAALVSAVERAEAGLLDADLGGGLIKQRVARKGGGRSAGYRTIIAYRAGTRAVFLYGFAKNERDNIDDDELRRWRVVGQAVLASDSSAIEAALKAGELTELKG